MKSKMVKVFWGIILILGGAFFLARNAGYFPEIPDGVWKYIFVAVSLLFFSTWIASGIRNWGWLFPASIFLGLSITILLAEIGDFGSLTATPLLASIALPFVVVYLLETRRNQWALIPAWVMLVVSMITLLADRISGNAMGAFVLYSIGFPFLVVFLHNQNNRWALIPAGILAIVGTLPIISSILSGEAVGVAVMLLFGIAFLVVFLSSKSNWWSLIPAGVFLSIALIVLLSVLNIGTSDDQNGLLPAVLLAGIGLTFGILWLLRASQPTGWAKYPAIGLFATAALVAITGRKFEFFWPIVLIIVGLTIIVNYFLRKPVQQIDSTPEK